MEIVAIAVIFFNITFFQNLLLGITSDFQAALIQIRSDVLPDYWKFSMLFVVC